MSASERTAAGFRAHPPGHVFQDTEVTVFFGQRESDLAALRVGFPEFEFATLHQTHSDRIVSSAEPSSEEVEADAHITRAPALALCVKTADCVPVLVYDPSSKMIAAIHAGWRGVENEIVLKTLRTMQEQDAHLAQARAWIGPHIALASFEVGLDVAEKLEARFQALAPFSPRKTSRHPHPDPLKAYIDLDAIVRAQLASVGITEDRVMDVGIDTVTSPAHESFRRDGSAAGRQLSFIALSGPLPSPVS